jgi:DNA-binding protein YbaB
MQRPSPTQIEAMLRAMPEDLGEFQSKLQESMLAVVNVEYTGTAADGEVEATCNGFGVLTRITIHRAARALDNLSLGDAVTEAVRKAEDAGRHAFRDGLATATFGGRSLTDFMPKLMAD